MSVKHFAILSALVIFGFVIELIRREKMTFRYALSWLSAALLVFLLSANERLLGWLSQIAGFSLPSNFVFFLFVISTILLSLLLTIYANEQNKRSEVLAQSVAILEYRLKRIESKQSHAAK